MVDQPTFSLKSSSFKDGGIPPKKHTCDGDDVSPLLEIRGAPAGAKSFALIVEDPDAPGGTYVHWLVWGIDARTQYISEDSVPDGAAQGTTSFGRPRYSGPCPPRGDKPHRYSFKLFALDAALDLPAGADRAALESAMAGHVVGTAELTCQYQRP